MAALRCGAPHASSCQQQSPTVRHGRDSVARDARQSMSLRSRISSPILQTTSQRDAQKARRNVVERPPWRATGSHVAPIKPSSVSTSAVRPIASPRVTSSTRARSPVATAAIKFDPPAARSPTRSSQPACTSSRKAEAAPMASAPLPTLLGARVPSAASMVAPNKPSKPQVLTSSRGCQDGGRVQQQTSQQHHPVVAFLRDCGLQMYASALLDSGFDELETLHDIEESDLKQLQMPARDVKLLRESLLRARGPQITSDEESEELATNPVAIFLTEHGLGQHAASFVNSGFDDLELLFDADDADLKDLGLSRGHALKLRRHLREHKQSKQASLGEVNTSSSALVVQPAAPTHPQLAATEQMKYDVIQSWERVQEMGTLYVGEVLYKYCFQLAPGAIDLFPPHVLQKYRQVDFNDEESDLKDAPALRKLFSVVLNAVGSAVAGLQRDIGTLVSMLTTLGARHAHYGVNEACWDVLAEALKFTLRDILGDGFTHEVQQAWSIVYGFIASIMIQGMKDAMALQDGKAEPSFDEVDDGSSIIGNQASAIDDGFDADVTEFQQCVASTGGTKHVCCIEG